MGIPVMIVDDSAFMRNMLKNFVVQSGGEVVAEGVDGNEAVAKYNELKPKLVFMDIMMPNKNGLEALKEIMQSDKDAKIIMCTSVGQEKVVAEAVEAGASDFIVKPFKPEDIKTVMGKYC